MCDDMLMVLQYNILKIYHLCLMMAQMLDDTKCDEIKSKYFYF